MRFSKTFLIALLALVSVLMVSCRTVEEPATEVVAAAAAETAIIDLPPAPEAEPVVISQSVYGYSLEVTVDGSTVTLAYPSVVTKDDAAGFYASEVEKYGASYLSGITYKLSDGATTLTVPASVSEDTIVSSVPTLADDIVAYVKSLVSGKAETAEPEAAEAGPVVVTNDIYGYELDVTIDGSTVTLAYPSIVTKDDAAGFFASEAENYGTLLNGVYYKLDDGSATITVPEGVSSDTLAAYIPALVSDIVAFAVK